MNSGKSDMLRLARTLMTRSEIKAKISPFDSKAWRFRKQAIKERVAKEEALVKKLKHNGYEITPVK